MSGEDSEAGRECRYSGASSGIGSIREVIRVLGTLGTFQGDCGAVRGCRGCQGCIRGLTGSVGTLELYLVTVCTFISIPPNHIFLQAM